MEYDPYAHRNLEHTTNYAETFAHLIKGVIGTGIFALPKSFYFSGIVGGIVGTAILAIISIYALQILLKCRYNLCVKHKTHDITYKQCVYLALQEGPSFLKNNSKIFSVVLDVFFVTFQLGVCCCYYLFTATTFKEIFETYVLSDKHHLVIYCTCLFIFFILIISIPNLKVLAPFSILSNAITVVGIIIVFYYTASDTKEVSSLRLIGKWNEYLLFCGAVLFSLQAGNVATSLENNMTDPRQMRGFCGILNLGMIIITVLYIIFAFCGYLKYGKDIEGSITLNLPQRDKAVLALNILYAISIWISFSLQAFVAVEIIYINYIEGVVENKTRALFYQYAVRYLIVILSFVFSASIPQFGLAVSLVGNVCLPGLAFFFPALVELSVHWPERTSNLDFIIAKDYFLFLFAFFAFSVGTYSSVYSIVTD